MGIETKAEMIQHDIQLTARTDKSGVSIEGEGDARLPRRSGAHRFHFILTDLTDPKLNVRFKRIDQGMLYVKDDVEVCPVPAGQDTTQIVGVTRSGDGMEASFTNRNSNEKLDMPVSYQLNFTCDDPAEDPAFDPIIINGGDD